MSLYLPEAEWELIGINSLLVISQLETTSMTTDTISEDLFEWDDNCLSAENFFVDFLSFQEEESKEIIASKDIVNDEEQQECESKN